MSPAGYSGTPLPIKLGLAPGTRAVVLGAPWPYRQVVTPLPEGVAIVARLFRSARFVHCFVTRRSDLVRRLPAIAASLDDAGMAWISWPKQSSGVETDVSEKVVRELALANRLVDVKVCAVDQVWSGLKLVRRVRDRAVSR
jgi:hypothetical protein